MTTDTPASPASAASPAAPASRVPAEAPGPGTSAASRGRAGLDGCPDPADLSGAAGVPDLRHSFVDAGGVRLHVAECGQGTPVVLLHGFPQHWYAWRRVLPLLRADHRLICLDLRGSGWSDAPARGYGTATRVTDLLAVLDTLGLDQVTLIGHEFGAWTGFMACLRAPERFTALLALNAVHPWPRHRRMLPQAWRYWYTMPLELPLLGRTVLSRTPGFTRRLLRAGVTDPAAWDAEAMAEFVRSTAGRPQARAAESVHRQYALRDIRGLVLGTYKKLRLVTPTVVLAGERDFALPPGVFTDPGTRAAALRIEVVPGCGHFVHEERPDLVARTLRDLTAG
jgi:pimeloyl-ACP methyl ester carboxylesterase